MYMDAVAKAEKGQLVKLLGVIDLIQGSPRITGLELG